MYVRCNRLLDGEVRSMRLIGLCLAPLMPFVLLCTAAVASVPPPPPFYVFFANQVLSNPKNKNKEHIAKLFADDVIANHNGERIASGKSAWLEWWSIDRSHYFGKTLGSSTGWREGGSLLLVEQFDTQDYASINPPPLGDPRPSTRSTLYRFSSDGLIHSIDIIEVNSFYVRN